MLAVLDPALFYASRPITESELDEVVRILRETRARIPDSFYWRRLELAVIRPFNRTSSRKIRVGLDTIRALVSAVRFPDPSPRVKVWSFRALFTPEWVELMTRTVTGCVLTGEETILITRHSSRRDTKTHSGPDRCRLIEKTCWNLRVQVPMASVRRIPDITNRRNVSIPWTTRFDVKLPAEKEASFPFCPPQEWFKSDVPAFVTHRGRPAWRDAKGNHWACPATGWGYHWDVYLEQKPAAEYGLDQLNVVRWGAPPAEGIVGELHHVPTEKEHRLKKRTGWSC
jgi:hypothetical protein